jgi:hypothetical protein
VLLGVFPTLKFNLKNDSHRKQEQKHEGKGEGEEGWVAPEQSGDATGHTKKRMQRILI